MKVCIQCDIRKENTYFDKSDTSSDGRNPKCKKCRLERAKELKELRANFNVGEWLLKWAK